MSRCFSFWDALILRAAKQSGCRIVFSEDMKEAREIDGLHIVNPIPLVPRFPVLNRKIADFP